MESRATRYPVELELERLTEGPKYVRGRLTTEVKVAVGSPASFVATDVESDSHGGNACVGAAMRGGEGDRNEVCQSRGFRGGRERTWKVAARRK